MTSSPESFNLEIPLPETLGSGSTIPTTTFFRPAFIIASVQGGVKP